MYGLFLLVINARVRGRPAAGGDGGEVEVGAVGQAGSEQGGDAPRRVGVVDELGGDEAVGFALDGVAAVFGPFDAAPDGAVADFELFDPAGGGGFASEEAGVVVSDGEGQAGGADDGVGVVEAPGAAVAADDGGAGGQELDPLGRGGRVRGVRRRGGGRRVQGGGRAAGRRCGGRAVHAFRLAAAGGVAPDEGDQGPRRLAARQGLGGPRLTARQGLGIRGWGLGGRALRGGHGSAGRESRVGRRGRVWRRGRG